MHLVFYGLKRSGNHVIIHWLLRNISKVIVEYMPSYIHLGKNVIYFNDVTNSAGAIQEEISKNTWQNYHIVASVEDIFRENLITNQIMTNPKKIFIIRNPFNCYASRIRSFESHLPIEKFKILYENMLKNITHDSIVIYYDSWWNDKSYRDKISLQIGLPNINDIIIQTKEGGGSAFTDNHYNNRSQHFIFDENTMHILNQLLIQTNHIITKND